jgi:hypothetical protein
VEAALMTKNATTRSAILMVRKSPSQASINTRPSINASLQQWFLFAVTGVTRNSHLVRHLGRPDEQAEDVQRGFETKGPCKSVTSLVYVRAAEWRRGTICPQTSAPLPETCQNDD